MSVKKLHQTVISKLESTSTINTLSQCVLELILNSLDAKSEAIAIRVNLVTFRVQIVDNGSGIDDIDMQNVGHSYMTNKWSKNNGKSQQFHGFRGNALASILKLCQSAKITSRHRDSQLTYTKSIKENKHHAVELSNTRRFSRGTTITIENFLYNVPVRKKIAKPEQELESIKCNMEHFAILYPEISFTLRNDVTGDLIFNAHKQKDIVHSLLNIHPNLTDDFSLIKVGKDQLVVKGLIHKEMHKKKMQYVYVNKRPVFQSELQQYLCDLLKKNRKNQKNKQNPAFVVNLKCEQVDFILLAGKTTCNFKNWHKIKKCLEKLVATFYGRSLDNQKIVPVKKQYVVKPCSISNMHGAIKGQAFKKDLYNIPADEETSPITEKQIPEEKSCTSENPLRSILKQSLNLATENSYCIDFTEEVDHQLEKQRKQPKPFKKPAPIAVEYEAVKKKKTSKERMSVANLSFYSRFTNNENKGKELIMDMFLKSTQVYSREDYCDRPQSRLDRNIQEMNTTMSISVKLQQRYVPKEYWPKNQRKALPERKIHRYAKEMISRGVQATSPPPPQKMITEGVQTSFKIFDKTIAAEDYTVFIPATEKKKPKFKRVKRLPMQENVDIFDTTEGFVCKCKPPSGPKFHFKTTEKEAILEDSFKDCNVSSSKSASTFDKFQTTETAISKYCSRKIKPTFKKFKTAETATSDNFPRNIASTYKKFKAVETPISEDCSRKIKPTFKKFETAISEDFPRKIKPTFKKFKTAETAISDDCSWMINPTFEKIKTAETPISEDFPQKIKPTFKKFKTAETPISEDFPRKIKPTFKKYKTAETAISEDFSRMIKPTFEKIKTPIIEDFPRKIKPTFKKFKTAETANSDDFFQNIASTSKKFKTAETPISEDYLRNTKPKFKKFKTSEIAISDYSQIVPTFTKFKPNFFSTQNDQINPALEGNFLNDTVNNFTSEEAILDMFQGENLMEKKSQELLASPSYDGNVWYKENDYWGDVRYVNKRTGFVKSQFGNTQSEFFELRKRSNILPKGFSPYKQEMPEFNQSMTQINKKKLHYALMEKCDDLRLLKWENYIADADPQQFFHDLYQEKNKLFEKLIPAVLPNHNKKGKTIKEHVFRKDLFQRLFVIGQVDCKFIATLDLDDKMIVVFDQHAVHERIRLEQLLGDVKESVQCNQITVFLPHLDLELLKKHTDYMNSYGFEVTFFSNTINVTSVPKILYNKLKTESSIDRNLLNKYVEVLVQDLIDILKETGVAVSIPPLLHSITCMDACRGAIKFGYFLSRKECKELIKSLSSCDLPFQCAHGRPTLTPLVRYSAPENTKKRICFANLFK